MKLMNNARLKSRVDAVNNATANSAWFDFEVFSFNANELIILGSRDFSYYHQLEIKFLDVAYFSGTPSWGSNPHITAVFSLIEESKALKVLQEKKVNGYFEVFEFPTDDGASIIIAALDIVVNMDTVYYYLRENLKENERIADWVKS
ncbi:hypothetical protein [Hahella sp. NBU794]|uniref:hypothetical protein n=1 Tax=Hahella sp. NBU794 TaxID=3422590 RepID=UPI003D6F8224